MASLDDDHRSIGLSQRSKAVVDDIMPKISAAVADRTRVDNPNIDLSTAENWLLRDELIEICKEAVSKDMTTKHFSYPNGFSGDPIMMQALACFINIQFQPYRPVDVSQIATAPGAASCLDALLYTICDAGDGVLVPTPYWNGFDFQFRVRASVIPVLVNCRSFGTALSSKLLQGLKKAIDESKVPIRGLVMTNPNNPFGQCYPREVLEECLRFCEQHNIHYISDEVYAMSTFESPDSKDLPPFTSVLSMDLATVGCSPSRVHVIWSISKDFGSSGIRLGCTISQYNPEIIVGLSLASNTQTSSLAAIFTRSLLASNQIDALIQLNRKRLSISYGLLTSWLQMNEFDYIPANAGIFVFARLCKQALTWNDEAALVQKCKEFGVLISAGRSYHRLETEKGWVRVTFAVEPNVLQKALGILARVLSVQPPAA
ncbi:hypothetical protein H0G86_005180 [Trichoderma simmonsii]|uniref:Aminotransferase class I/classII large domain-containing protein n=1 Tax=Trichoderma simmonsii TaxID=1491479 RepID=A0A8G0PG48_9HYPO|nr:hypothetical protein H0G86_005180 [Trichoderma simmonsii]